MLSTRCIASSPRPFSSSLIRLENWLKAGFPATNTFVREGSYRILLDFQVNNNKSLHPYTKAQGPARNPLPWLLGLVWTTQRPAYATGKHWHFSLGCSVSWSPGQTRTRNRTRMYIGLVELVDVSLEQRADAQQHNPPSKVA